MWWYLKISCNSIFFKVRPWLVSPVRFWRTSIFVWSLTDVIIIIKRWSKAELHTFWLLHLRSFNLQIFIFLKLNGYLLTTLLKSFTLQTFCLVWKLILKDIHSLTSTSNPKGVAHSEDTYVDLTWICYGMNLLFRSVNLLRIFTWIFLGWTWSLMRGRGNQVVEDTGSQRKTLWSSCNAASVLLSQFEELHLPDNRFENGKQCPANRSSPWGSPGRTKWAMCPGWSQQSWIGK